MAATPWEKVVEEVKALTPEEQRRLRDLLDAWLAAAPPAPAKAPMTEEEFAREMARRGLMSVPPPITDLTPYRNWEPVEIEGKPLSETVIEERR